MNSTTGSDTHPSKWRGALSRNKPVLSLTVPELTESAPEVLVRDCSTGQAVFIMVSPCFIDIEAPLNQCWPFRARSLSCPCLSQRPHGRMRTRSWTVHREQLACQPQDVSKVFAPYPLHNHAIPVSRPYSGSVEIRSAPAFA